MSAEEIAQLVQKAIAEVGATSRAQMGAVMKALGPTKSPDGPMAKRLARKCSGSWDEENVQRPTFNVQR